MSIFVSLSVFALRQVIGGACDAVGFKAGGEVTDQVVGFLTERFTDHSLLLTAALQSANDKAWTALEVSLAGDSLWERCKLLAARAEDKGFARQVRTFLDAVPLPELDDKMAFRQKCLEELRAARKARMLAGDTLDPRQLARQTADFARFGDPATLVEAEWRVVVGMADEMKQAGYTSLAWFLSQRPRQGMPVLVVAVRYFFRRAVEEDQRLFRGLSFAKLEALSQAQEQGFACLSGALAQQGHRLEELLGDVKAVMVETHAGVQRIEEQMVTFQQRISELTARLGMRDRQVRSTDTRTIRSEEERRLVREMLAQYRALPESERRQRPALLSAVARLENAAGNHAQAVDDFRAAATLSADDKPMQAESHYNAYQAALERAGKSKKKEDWNEALNELVKAVNRDRRFLPFDARKYQPQRILGAGGFGVTFLCKRRGPDDLVAVKSLTSENLDRPTKEVLEEGRLLGSLDHPAIIRMIDCDYADPDSMAGPFLVMEFFDGQTLEELVTSTSLMPVEEAVTLFRLVAEGLMAAHAKGVLHRDIKPANLLVRREANAWRVKVIDFGLALRGELTQAGMMASTSRQSKSLVGESIAGTLHYAAPEQMDAERQQEVGHWSDVYGFGKTCYYALFGTPTPDDDDKDRLPDGLKRLLSRCTAQVIGKRPQRFAEVVDQLSRIENGLIPVLELVEDASHEFTKKIPETTSATAMPPVLQTHATVRIFCPAESWGKKAFSIYFSPVTNPAFKIYLDGKLLKEELVRNGFDFRQTLPLGTHNLEIAEWNKKEEKARKSFELNLSKIGNYEFRFNYPDLPPRMNKSTLEIIMEPS
jgi:serine/threonine protein kinase